MGVARLVAGGLKSFLPFGKPYSMSAHEVDPKYGYAVWLRHVSLVAECGMRGPFVNVLELGPGNSVATGACAILSGAAEYIGVDVLDHVAWQTAPRVLREIQRLFEAQAPIPNASEYPGLRPSLSAWAFPARALASFRGDDSAAIRAPVEALDISDLTPIAGSIGPLRYLSARSENIIDDGTVDYIMSQAVLGEIPHSTGASQLRKVMLQTKKWLRPGGVASHQIDLGMYGLSPWNVHWGWSNLTWQVIRGRRENYPNRVPVSTYLKIAEEVGFELVHLQTELESGIPDSHFAREFQELPEQDRQVRSAFIVLRNPS